MKEDILEELIDGYLLRQPGTFTKHNVKYRPSLSQLPAGKRNKYSVHSDIDVLAYDAINHRVNAVSCKSWQSGFNLGKYLPSLSDPANHQKQVSGRAVWKAFREICHPVWARAFREKILSETGSNCFTYTIAVTKIIRPDLIEEFENNKFFLQNLGAEDGFMVNIKLLTLQQMIRSINDGRRTTTIEPTEIGRFLQLVSAAGLRVCEK